MPVTSHLGGLLPHRRGPHPDAVASLERNGAWRCTTPAADLFLESSGACHTFLGGSCAVLLRGHAVGPGVGSMPDAAAFIGRHYQEHGTLPTDKWQGSFTVVVLDGRANRVVLYRNLVGSTFTYYTQTAAGFLFGSNLAGLVARAGIPPRANEAVLPAYFLFRFVPGRETLFAGVYRLMPGEQVTFSLDGLARQQQHTLADLCQPGAIGADAVDRIEGTMGTVLAEAAARSPDAANLLSGGVDSSYIQAQWNRATPGRQPLSYSVSVDHPRTKADTEYALTAARALGVQHNLVPADEPYVHYLVETIATTGEPPNHVMAAYFGHLAKEMHRRGHVVGLCGEGADSLFGTGWADVLQRARHLRQLLPIAPLRRSLSVLAGKLGRPYLASTLGVADCLHDLGHRKHPVNQIGAFADWDAVSACFGGRAVAEATAYRRTLLAQQRIPDIAEEQVHACGFLGEAMDSAALWTTLFNRWQGDLCCPFLDSRVIGLALSIAPEHRFPAGQPKDLLKRALCRHMPHDLVYRGKLGFGQPIFEWLAPGGQLRAHAEAIDDYPFVEHGALATALARPNWFLYSLLCYDIWHKLFIRQSLPRVAAAWEAAAVG